MQIKTIISILWRFTAGEHPIRRRTRGAPIYQTTFYTFSDADYAARLFGLQEFGNIYTHLMNSAINVFEQRIAALEGGAAASATASGQAAETLGVLMIVKAGDEIVSPTSLSVREFPRRLFF